MYLTTSITTETLADNKDKCIMGRPSSLITLYIHNYNDVYF